MIGLATKHQGLSSVPGAHMIEGRSSPAMLSSNLEHACFGGEEGEGSQSQGRRGTFVRCEPRDLWDRW